MKRSNVYFPSHARNSCWAKPLIKSNTLTCTSYRLLATDRNRYNIQIRIRIFHNFSLLRKPGFLVFSGSGFDTYPGPQHRVFVHWWVMKDAKNKQIYIQTLPDIWIGQKNYQKCIILKKNFGCNFFLALFMCFNVFFFNWLMYLETTLMGIHANKKDKVIQWKSCAAKKRKHIFSIYM